MDFRNDLLYCVRKEPVLVLLDISSFMRVGNAGRHAHFATTHPAVPVPVVFRKCTNRDANSGACLEFDVVYEDRIGEGADAKTVNTDRFHGQPISLGQLDTDPTQGGTRCPVVKWQEHPEREEQADAEFEKVEDFFTLPCPADAFSSLTTMLLGGSGAKMKDNHCPILPTIGRLTGGKQSGGSESIHGEAKETRPQGREVATTTDGWKAHDWEQFVAYTEFLDGSRCPETRLPVLSARGLLKTGEYRACRRILDEHVPPDIVSDVTRRLFGTVKNTEL